MPAGFYAGVWKELLELVRGYVQHYRRLVMWVGPVYDSDEGADEFARAPPFSELARDADEGASGDPKNDDADATTPLPPAGPSFVNFFCIF